MAYDGPQGTKRKDHHTERSEDAADPSEGVMLWDTVSNLNGYPLLRVSVEMAKENFDLCLSRSYDKVDKKDTQDHLQVVLGLKGSFNIDKDNEYPNSYATSSVTIKDGKTRGIFLNKSIAAKSKGVVHGKSPEEILNNRTALGIIAVMQQTVEHELGHIKYHQEGIDDPGYKKATPTKTASNYDEDTPTETSLDGEAGYAVQRQIRHDSFGRKNRQEPLILGIDQRTSQPFDPTADYDFCHCRIKPKPDRLDAEVVRRNLTMDDIIKHMDYYPTLSENCCTGPDSGFNPPTDGDGRGDRGDGSGPSGGGGGAHPGREGDGEEGAQRGSPWLDSVKMKLMATMADANIVWNPPEFDFCSNPKNPSFDQRVELFDVDFDDRDALNANIAGLLACEIKIIPCDKNWEEMERLTPDEYIFAKIEIKNTTRERVLMQVCLGKGFGRHGIQLEFVDIQPGYNRGGSSQFGIPIKPGETYTLLRHFASGNDPSIVCAYNTPQAPGIYSLRVKYIHRYYLELGQIEIVGGRDV